MVVSNIGFIKNNITINVNFLSQRIKYAESLVVVVIPQEEAFLGLAVEFGARLLWNMKGT